MFNFDETNSKLAVFPSQNNETMYHKFNDSISLQNATTDNSEEHEDLPTYFANCKYYDLDEFSSSNFSSKNYLSFFHMNIASLTANIDDFTTLLSFLDFDFTSIGITETKIKKEQSPLLPFLFRTYSYVQARTETSFGEHFFIYQNSIHYKRRPDLN